jgi:hypothetical protein
MPSMFLRFVCPTKIDGMAAREGFFCAAYRLRRSAMTPPEILGVIEDQLTWFRKNLKVPPRFSRSTSKGADRGHTIGISWFKTSALEHLSKSYELISLLHEQGYAISTLKTFRPGYVVFEDEFQIVAEPFADTPM